MINAQQLTVTHLLRTHSTEEFTMFTFACVTKKSRLAVFAQR